MSGDDDPMFFDDDGVEAYNELIRQSIVNQLGDVPPEAFTEDVMECVDMIEDLIMGAVDALDQGFTTMAVYSLLRGTMQAQDPATLEIWLAACITHEATERFIEEQTDGISGSETE